MKVFNNKFLNELLFSEFIFSHNVSKKTLTFVDSLKLLFEFKQFYKLLNFALAQQLNIYIICNTKQQIFLFRKFLQKYKNIFIITKAKALLIDKQSFFILIDKSISKPLVDKLFMQTNSLLFIINQNCNVNTSSYKISVSLNNLKKILFIITFINKSLQKTSL